MSSPQTAVNDRRRLAAFIALGLAQAAIYARLATWRIQSDEPTAAMLLALAAFALYLAALAVARPLSGRSAAAAALALGALFRILLLPDPPLLSDDHFRYLWDGLLQLRGVNPYRYAPADPALAGINDALRAQVNHPEVHTIYPPLAELVFWLAALVREGSWLPLKLVWLACDSGIAALLHRLVPRERRLQAWTLYWWSPLVVIEVAWNAHLDLLGLLPLMLALALARRPTNLPRSAGIGLAIAASALVKYFAVAFLPAAARAARPARRALLIPAFLLGIAALYLPYAGAGRTVLDGLFTYARSWRFNDSLFGALSWAAGSPLAAKAVAGGVVLFLIIQSARNEWTLERAAFWLTGAAIILSPTVHPWYLLWIVPLVAIRPNRAWLYLSGSVFLAYYGLADYRAVGEWPEPWWTKALIYGPFYALLAYDAWHGSWWQAAWAALRTGGPAARRAARRGTQRP